MASYTPPSQSGYNSLPPSDDGTESTANRVDWDTIKTKLSDPNKNYADAINSATSSAFDIEDASRHFSGIDFGITGDGVTDDINKINTAITTISQTGGTLMLQAGSYMCSSKVIMKKNVTLLGVTEQGSGPSVRIIGTHSGDVIEYLNITQPNGGIVNLSIEKDAANYFTGAGVRVNTTGASVSGNGFVKGCYFFKVSKGLHLTAAIFWQLEDLQIKEVTYGIHFDGTGPTSPDNNLNYGKNLVINANNGAGVGLLYEGKSNSNHLFNVDLSGCTQALHYNCTVNAGRNNTITGLWLEQNTSHLLIDEGLSLIVRDVNIGQTFPLIATASLKPEILRIRGASSLEGSSLYSIGTGALETYDTIASSELYTKDIDTYRAHRIPQFVSHETGCFKDLISLSSASPYFSNGAPKKNLIVTALTSWGGAGTKTGSIADPWKGTTGYSLNGVATYSTTITGSVASRRFVLCALVKGKDVNFTAVIFGSASLFSDNFTLKDDNWYLFSVIRDIPSTQSGTTLQMNISSDALMSVTRPSLYEDDGCIIPMEYGADTTDMYSVAMHGPNLRCIGPLADPTVGRWIQGDRIDYQAVVTADFMGRVCTTGGSVGTWKTWGVTS